MHVTTRSRFVPAAVLAAVLAVLVVFASSASGAAHQRAKADVVLTLLHNNDAESAFFETTASDGQQYGGIAPFASVVADLKRSATTGRPSVPGTKRVELMVSSGDNYLAGSNFRASLEKGIPYYDAIGMSLIGYDASAIGNHEFDFGPDVFEAFVRSFSPPLPFVSANLDFSGEPGLQALVDAGVIAGSVVVKERGEQFGIVGATTPALPAISSPRNVEIEAVAPAVQAEVDRLTRQGVNKIIFISHLQSLTEDLELLAELDGIDVAVAGGGDELLANPGDLLIPGDVAAGPYPTLATDADGRPVPVVTTSGAYRYVGRLEMSFDRTGNVISIGSDSGPVRVTTGPDNPDAVSPDPNVQSQVVEPVAEFVSELATTSVGVTQVPLDSRRGNVTVNGGITVTTRGERVSETNLGNIATDAYVAIASDLAPTFGVPVPDVGLTNGGGIRLPDAVLYPNATPASPATVTRLDVDGQFPFPNFLSVSENMTAATLKGILETGVSRVQNVDGRFAQVSGLVYRWDSTRDPVVRDLTTCEILEGPGDRITYIAHDPGNDGVGVTVLYDADAGGWQVDEDEYTMTVASINFLSIQGGDCWDFGDATTTTLGVTYGQVVEQFIVEDLTGVITQAEYPFEGTDRIQQED